MDRIRNFLSGEPTNNTYNGRNNTNNNNTFGMSGQRRYNNNNNDNLYLSDDEDDWGMSAYGSDTRRYAYTERRTSSSNTQFWDQSSISEDMQAWERQSESNVSQFEIGNDDYYHSDTHEHRKHLQKPHIGHHNEQQQPSSYDDVEHDIQTLEDTEADNESSAASNNNNKEEVVNAYRDYLKSIRDGGFESYLNKNEEEEGGQVLSWKSDDQIIGNGGGGGEDEALERVLDMEEERRATSSLYGDNLYGGASADNGTSPYSAWRAKAKALLRQEEERERSSSDAISSPSRQMLDKFRRKRSRDGNSGISRQQQQNGYYAQTNNGDHSGMTDKLYSYKNAIFQNQRVRGVCIGICLILALTAGLSYYGGKNSSTTEEDDTSILPSDDLLASPALPDEDKQNDAQSFAPSDAVLNSLRTFDPVWYDRHQGWEVSLQ